MNCKVDNEVVVEIGVGGGAWGTMNGRAQGSVGGEIGVLSKAGGGSNDGIIRPTKENKIPPTFVV